VTSVRQRFFSHPLAAAVLAVCFIACRRGPEDKKPGPRVPSSATGTTEAALVEAVRNAEYTRDEKALPAEALSSRDAGIRRMAARALARIATEAAAERLEKGLGDEDSEVAAWSAYGLGYACKGREDETVRRLTTRAVTLPASNPRASDGRLLEFSTTEAFAGALARCGGAAAERTLVAWFEHSRERARAAVVALGRLAGTRHRLSDEAIVLLLDRASAADAPPEALYPFGRLETLSEAASKRLAEVAKAALAAGGERRTLAIHALGSVGEPGIEPLSEVFADEAASSLDRSAAAAELGRIGGRAGQALGLALARLVPADATLDERFVSKNSAALAAAFATALWPNRDSRDALSRLADTPITADAPPALARRIVALRCGAAAVLAGKASRATKLVACDPDPDGHARALAELRVLDRGELRGARFARWRELSDAKDPGIRRAALALVPAHPEMPAIVDPLVRAIEAQEPGIAAQAARVIATEPRRASEKAILDRPPPKELSVEPVDRALSASPKIVDALARAMDADRPADQIEPRVAFMDAAAALGSLSLKSRIERSCASTNVTLRRRAERALSLLGHARAACPDKPGPRFLEDPPVVSKVVTLTFLTDAGRLGMTLDPVLAPLAAGRITALARAGFFTGIRIHRAAPGFVVQFGDPVGDGSGGSGKPPLPCETSPVDFSAFSVGVALSGRDTGSSQIFVTLTPQRHLDGDYTAVGRADPEWANVAEGDVIQSVEVR
jgi:cyclophilin family peptidyl-prolyl cis-trans isomerase